MTESTLVVVRLLVAGFRLRFIQVIHLGDVSFFYIVKLSSLSIIFDIESFLQNFDRVVLLDEVDKGPERVPALDLEVVEPDERQHVHLQVVGAAGWEPALPDTPKSLY